MAKCPFAVQRILPESATQHRITPRIIIDHTQAGTGSLYGYWASAGVGLEDHFQVLLDGTIEQHMDTEVQADANLEANRWVEDGESFGAIAIETENSRAATDLAYRGGQGAAAFDRDPWTPEQIASLIRLHDWLADTHPTILRQRCDRPLGAGLGYHSMWGTGPTPWIPYKSRGKKCPGDARIEQHNRLLLPAFVGGTSAPTKDWSDMATKAEIEAAVKAGVKAALAEEAWNKTRGSLGYMLRGISRAVLEPSEPAEGAKPNAFQLLRIQGRQIKARLDGRPGDQ